MIGNRNLYPFAVVALLATVSQAEAKCDWSGPGYRPEANGSLELEMTCDTSGGKHYKNPPGDGYVMTSISIVTKPHNGTLRVWGKNDWSYVPKSPGSDLFSYKQCATLYESVSGCTTLIYHATIK